LREQREFVFDIDVVGASNLRCPSCPQGNVVGYRLPHGNMEPELLKRIVDKAQGECRVRQINLFAWAEPLLHPQLPELVNIVQARGIPCHLSSNLNILPHADAIMAANPASFKISASGYTQEIYGFSHRGGNVAKVKKHMQELAKAKKRANAATRIYVNYHRYRHNLKEEPLMREYAASLGIGFEPVWALMLPLEKIIGHLEGVEDKFSLTEEDDQLIEHLALPFKEALASARQERDQPCRLRDSQISLDFQGNVQLCCGVFDASRFTLGHFIDMSLDEIQEIRNNHAMCARCLPLGGHVYLTYGIQNLLQLVMANISQEDVKLLHLENELAQKRLWQIMYRMYAKLPVDILSSRQKEAVLTCVQRVISGARRTFSRRGN
jgi:MoaA/NifB/PqqE/SkfB family radical SAM enzyme